MGEQPKVSEYVVISAPQPVRRCLGQSFRLVEEAYSADLGYAHRPRVKSVWTTC